MAKKLSIAFTLVLFGLLLTSAESKGGFSDNQERFRRHAALSSSIVRAQVPVSANHFNQLNATDTACCCEPLVQFKEAHRWTMLWKLFRRPLQPTSAVWVRDGGTGKDGGHGTFRQHSDNLSARACWFLSPFPPYPRLYKGYTAHLI